MLTHPLIVLTPSMACRVFRNLRLQNLSEKETSTTLSASLAARSHTRKFILDTGEMRQPDPTFSDYAPSTSV